MDAKEAQIAGENATSATQVKKYRKNRQKQSKTKRNNTMEDFAVDEATASKQFAIAQSSAEVRTQQKR